MRRLADAVAVGRLGDPPVEGARVPAGTGGVIAWMTACLGAHHVAVIDGAGGQAAWWVMKGMPIGGTVTLLGVDEADVDAVRESLRSGIDDAHARVIPGPVTDVLGRLSDGAYELVVIADARSADRGLHQHVIRLLTTGGVAMLLDVEPDGAVPGDQGPLPGLVRDVVENPRLQSAVLTVEGGAVLARLAEEPTGS